MAVAVAGALVLHVFGFWVLWHSLLTDVYGRPGLGAAIKDFYLGDQYAYLGIAANVEHGRSAYLEPYTATGSSIYPSGYFWLLGGVARVAGTTVFGAWNAVGMAVDLALFGVIGGFAWALTRSMWAWLLGPLPVIVGTFQYWTIGSWRAIYGDHAVLWPAAASLFSPGAEPAAILLTAAAAMLLVLGARREGPARLAMGSGAGVALALTVHVHTYVSIFAATAVALWFLVRSWQGAADVRDRVALVGLVAATVVAIALVPASIPILRVVLIVVAGLGAAAVSAARRELVPLLTAIAVPAGVVAAPMLLRVGSQVGDRSSFLYLRQASGVATNLSLPVGPVVFHSAPALVLTAGCLLHLRRRRLTGLTRPGDEAWAAALVAALLASTLLVFNESWGLQQEPYRFLPYAQVLLAALALPWLVDRPAGAWPAAVIARVGVGAVLALAVPTTLQFVRETPAIVQSPAPEQDALRALAASLPSDGLAMLDACLPKGAFKALTGARVVGMNAGLAYPADVDAVRAVLSQQAEGAVADGETLGRAGVTSFVTMDGCNGPTPAALAGRFGAPIQRVRLSPPPPCGLPALELQVYARDPGEAGAELQGIGMPTEPGAPAHPWAPCVLSNRRADVG